MLSNMKPNFVAVHEGILHELVNYIKTSDFPNPSLTNRVLRHTRKYNPEYKERFHQTLKLKEEVRSQEVLQAQMFLAMHRNKVLRYPGFNYAMSIGVPYEEKLKLCDKLRMIKVNRKNGKILCSIDDGGYKTTRLVELSWILNYNFDI